MSFHGRVSGTRIKRALGLEEQPSSIFFEQYDNEPIVDIKNPAEVERLKALLPGSSV